MPAWKCPSCETTVQHQDAEPRVGVIYRCQICRLDLTYDPQRARLVVAPVSDPG
jgi:rubredoxin